jgi:hypothetical protein
MLDAIFPPGVAKLERSSDSIFVLFVSFVVTLCRPLVLYFGTSWRKAVNQWHGLFWSLSFPKKNPSLSLIDGV